MTNEGQIGAGNPQHRDAFGAMSKVHGARKQLRLPQWLPPMWLIAGLFVFMELSGLLRVGLGIVAGLSNERYDVFIAPVLEELLKLLIVLKFRDYAVQVIIAFGILEFGLVKIPIFQNYSGFEELAYLLAVATLAMLFHVSTALAYRFTSERSSTYGVFLCCVTLHLVWNLLSLFDLQIGAIIFLECLICGVVIYSSRKVASFFGSRKPTNLDKSGIR